VVPKLDDELAGQPRKLITHSVRNGFIYTMDRHNGQILPAKPYLDNINWTRGIDQKTGRPSTTIRQRRSEMLRPLRISI
jgi:alcohol dehydrogenase (cytochrome c)